MKRRRRPPVSSPYSPSCSSPVRRSSGSSAACSCSPADCSGDIGTNARPSSTPACEQTLRKWLVDSHFFPFVLLFLGLFPAFFALFDTRNTGYMFVRAELPDGAETASADPASAPPFPLSSSLPRVAVVHLPSGQTVHASAESRLDGEGSHRVLSTRVDILSRAQKARCGGNLGQGGQSHESPCSSSSLQTGKQSEGEAERPVLACNVECTYTLENIAFVDPDQTWELGIGPTQQASPSSSSACLLSAAECEAPRISTQVLDDFVDIELPVFSPQLSPYTQTRQKTLSPLILRKAPGLRSSACPSSLANGLCGEKRDGETKGRSLSDETGEIYAGCVTLHLPFHLRYDAACTSCGGLTKHFLSPPVVRVDCREGRGGDKGGVENKASERKEERQRAAGVVCDKEACVATLVVGAYPANGRLQGRERERRREQARAMFSPEHCTRSCETTGTPRGEADEERQ
ncbi:unnamed protein product [Neospora caninum Liverpool]|uniref:Transmembrane protein n=1 Tax=Neospora caninum (strain Liverpool) TaxID=572307 RepID=F0VAG0_NEOCL|nr:uncharacterized protein NCLIV_011165 [Neospora caninum Liverpool]CBZ50649.1 unnamed protein product [Neospora caninum Liverpool]|eukprot:XP_003880682.1 uncharacterized protein NCLIV_011165 [Neospora caninum Liverpool]